MNLVGNLPVELISCIMKHCDLRTKTQFLLVNRELHNEIKRHLIPTETMTYNERLETLSGKGDVKIVVVYDNVRRLNPVKGKDRIEYYNKNNKLHRENNPAIIFYYENGNKRAEIWNINGVTHREDGPAMLGWYKNGNKQYENWYKNGLIHRKQTGEGSGPAETGWYENGNKQYEYWYINGKQRRKYTCRGNKLPYYTSWDENGKMRCSNI